MTGLRINRLLTLLLPVLFSILSLRIAGAQNPDSLYARNVLFIMGDDHAPFVTGAYGNELIRTPNLDRLASESALFTRAYVNSPVCTPSRQSIITGKLPHATGVTLLRTALGDDQVTIAEHLKRYGYRTGAIGKMHFNSALKHGFDERIDRGEYAAHLKKHPPRKPDEEVAVRPPWRPFQDPSRIWLNADGLPSGTYDEESEGTFFANKAVEFLRNTREEPFCLWVSFYEPHSPFNFPIEYAGRYDPDEMPLPELGPEDARWIPEVFRDLSDADKRGIVRSYYTSVEYLDKNIGLVLDALDASGLDENTLVIYVGDHGYLLGHHGRFEKHMMWEEAVRAPLLIKSPGLEAKKIEGLTEFVDLVPTILDILDVPLMDGLHGKSLIPLLTGEELSLRDHVFSEYLPDNKVMVRTDTWKYIFSTGWHDLAMGYATGNGPAGIKHRLYNLAEDPDERKNVANDPESSGILKRIQQMALQRFLETHPRAAALPPQLSLEEALIWFCEPPEPDPRWDLP